MCGARDSPFTFQRDGTKPSFFFLINHSVTANALTLSCIAASMGSHVCKASSTIDDILQTRSSSSFSFTRYSRSTRSTSHSLPTSRITTLSATMLTRSLSKCRYGASRHMSSSPYVNPILQHIFFFTRKASYSTHESLAFLQTPPEQKKNYSDGRTWNGSR